MLTDLELIQLKIALMKDSGKVISQQDWASKPGKIKVFTKGSICKERSTDRENTCGQTEVTIKGNGTLTKWKD
jgi:hypothetical protein